MNKWETIVDVKIKIAISLFTNKWTDWNTADMTIKSKRDMLISTKYKYLQTEYN